MKQVLLALALTAGALWPAALAAHVPPRLPEASPRRPPPAPHGGPNRTEPKSFTAQASLRRPPPANPGDPNRTEPSSFTAQDGPSGAASPRGAAALQEHAAFPTPYPMDTVDHQKRPGGVYAEGSPLYPKQRAAHAEAAQADELAAPAEEVLGPPPPVEEEVVVPLSPADHMPDALRQANDTLGSPLVSPWQEPRRVLTDLPLWQEALVWMSVHLLFVVLVCILAWLYRSYGKAQYSRTTMPSQGDAFAYPLLSVRGIGQDWPICFMAFCCPVIRWADTMSMAPLLPFWAALGLMVLLACLQPATGGLISLLSVLVAVYFRQRLRRIYNHGPFTPKNMVLDCLTWSFCCWCAIVQEAREVEHVQKTRFSSGGGVQASARGMSSSGGGCAPQPAMAHLTTPGSRYMTPAHAGSQAMAPDSGFAPPGPGMPQPQRDGRWLPDDRGGFGEGGADAG